MKLLTSFGCALLLEIASGASGLSGSGNLLFGLKDVPLPPDQAESLAVLVSPKIIGLPFGASIEEVRTALDHHQKAIPGRGYEKLLIKLESGLCRHVTLIFVDSQLAAIEANLDDPPRPTVAALNQSMSAVVKTLGRPERVLLTSRGGTDRNGIAFRWDKAEAGIWLRHYYGSDHVWGGLWVCSKRLPEKQIWDMREYQDAPPEETMSALWKAWLDRFIAPSEKSALRPRR